MERMDLSLNLPFNAGLRRLRACARRLGADPQLRSRFAELQLGSRIPLMAKV
jgi:hypothetical protein